MAREIEDIIEEVVRVVDAKVAGLARGGDLSLEEVDILEKCSRILVRVRDDERKGLLAAQRYGKPLSPEELRAIAAGGRVST